MVETEAGGRRADRRAFSAHYFGPFHCSRRQQISRAARFTLRTEFGLYDRLESPAVADCLGFYVAGFRIDLLLRAGPARPGLEMVNAGLSDWNRTLAAGLVRVQRLPALL